MATLIKVMFITPEHIVYGGDSIMSYIDGLGEKIKNGELATESAKIAVTTDGTQTPVTVSGLTTVQDAHAKFVNPGNATTGNGINSVDISAGNDNQVGVTLVDNGDTNPTDLDVEVIAQGY